MASGERLEALVVGGGPAGLAVSRELRRRGVEHRVLERGDQPGHSWARLYDSLTLHTGRHMSVLPGLGFARGTPMFVPRAQFLAYLHEYAERACVPLETACDVIRAEQTEGGWRVETSRGTLQARALVVATGVISNPHIPEFAGRDSFAGRVIHSVEYRRPDAHTGRRVLVIGAGNSGAEISAELARSGAMVTIAVRSGVNVLPLRLLGIPIQYHAYLIRRLPRPVRTALSRAAARLGELRQGAPVLPRAAQGPLDAIPLIGYHLVDAIREGLVRVRGGVERFTAGGVRFSDGTEEPFEDVILATGFCAALSPLGYLVRVDARGFALRRDAVASADHSALYFVGHNYDTTGALYNISRDARTVAERIGK